MSYSIEAPSKKYSIYIFRYDEGGTFIFNKAQIKMDEREQEVLDKENQYVSILK